MSNVWGAGSGSAYAINSNTNTMDDKNMTSDRAEAARIRSAEIMAALKKGEKGDADKLMGDMKQQQEGKEGKGMGWFKRKLSGVGKEGKEARKGEDDGVIR